MPEFPQSVSLAETLFWSVALVGLTLWVGAVINSRRRGRGLWGTNRNVRAGWGLLDVAGIAFVWLAAQFIATALWHSVAGIDSFPDNAPDGVRAGGSVFAGAAGLAAVILGLSYLMVRYRHGPEEFGLGTGQRWKGVRQGLTGFAMWVPVVWAIHAALSEWIPYSHPTIETLVNHPSPRVIAGVWFNAVLVAPIVEEVFFRGVLQGWLQRLGREDSDRPFESLVLGRSLVENSPDASPPDLAKGEMDSTIHVPAIVVASALFALAHANQGPAPISLFILSLGIGYMYQRTGSLLACVVMHMTLNFATLALLGIGGESA